MPKAELCEKAHLLSNKKIYRYIICDELTHDYTNTFTLFRGRMHVLRCKEYTNKRLKKITNECIPHNLHFVEAGVTSFRTSNQH